MALTESNLSGITSRASNLIRRVFASIALAALARGSFAQFREVRAGLKDRTPILTFHDIIPRRDDNSLWFDCTEAEFLQILDWLQARGAHFISLGQLYAHLIDGSKLPSNPVAITFADGYLGFYQRAVPILRKRHIPAAMFVHTAFVGRKVGRPKMDWAQLKELDREGLISIQSQTVTHPADLRTLNWAQLDKEMGISKATLEKQLRHPVRFIAYPNGKWNESSVAAARRSGYIMGFTEELRPAESARSILAVPRYVHTKYRKAWSDSHRG